MLKLLNLGVCSSEVCWFGTVTTTSPGLCSSGMPSCPSETLCCAQKAASARCPNVLEVEPGWPEIFERLEIYLYIGDLTATRLDYTTLQIHLSLVELATSNYQLPTDSPSDST